MGAVVATTVVWMVARAAFWIGHHCGPEYRTAGLTGMLQSMLVLLYVAARFGFDMGGVIGAAAPPVLFACLEAYLVFVTRSPPR